MAEFLEFLAVFQYIFYSTISRPTLSDILQNPSWKILLHCFAARSFYSQRLVTLLIAVFLLIHFGPGFLVKIHFGKEHRLRFHRCENFKRNFNQFREGRPFEGTECIIYEYDKSVKEGHFLALLA